MGKNALNILSSNLLHMYVCVNVHACTCTCMCVCECAHTHMSEDNCVYYSLSTIILLKSKEKILCVCIMSEDNLQKSVLGPDLANTHPLSHLAGHTPVLETGPLSVLELACWLDWVASKLQGSTCFCHLGIGSANSLHSLACLLCKLVF